MRTCIGHVNLVYWGAPMVHRERLCAVQDLMCFQPRFSAYSCDRRSTDDATVQGQDRFIVHIAISASLEAGLQAIWGNESLIARRTDDNFVSRRA